MRILRAVRRARLVLCQLMRMAVAVDMGAAVAYMQRAELPIQLHFLLSRRFLFVVLPADRRRPDLEFFRLHSPRRDDSGILITIDTDVVEILLSREQRAVA